MDKLRTLIKFRPIFLLLVLLLVAAELWGSVSLRLSAILAGAIVVYLIDNALLNNLRKYYRMATHDELTGLANYRMLMAKLREEADRANRYHRNLCLVVIDLDKFKDFNDQFGHIKGNDLLQAIAKVFQNTIRECDLAGRFGGDEFMVILPETNLEEANIVAQRLQERTRTHLRQHFPGDVEMSLGVATYQGESLKDLLAKVDGLMYQVKRKQGINSLSA